jgi:hypothetical protein
MKTSSIKPGPLLVRTPPESGVTRVKTVVSPFTNVSAQTKANSVPLKPTLQSPSAPVDPSATTDSKFKAAQEKAKLSGVHTLTQNDIEGLSSEQIKELRGY